VAVITEPYIDNKRIEECEEVNPGGISRNIKI
jgi:hypothetical protein